MNTYYLNDETEVTAIKADSAAAALERAKLDYSTGDLPEGKIIGLGIYAEQNCKTLLASGTITADGQGATVE